MTQPKIGFIGAGQMAQALARGFVAAGVVPAERIAAADPVAAAVSALAAAVPGVKTCPSNAEAAQGADVVILAVKPQHMAAAMREVRAAVDPRKLVISIAAGVTLATLAEGLGTGRLIRAMPNTPCLVGMSATGFSLGPEATASDGELAARLFGSVGIAFSLDEKLLDAVTGLAGSGPAFVYVLIEALGDGGVRAGLPRNVAAALAAQTVRGAAEMVQRTGEHPAVLKDRVASPGGTTIAGLHALEQHGLRSALIAAVEAAARRSAELGKNA
jgi:pyrroline-5-carboxylate reductase